MTTISTKTMCSNTLRPADYTSIDSWESGEQCNLVSLDTIKKLELLTYGTTGYTVNIDTPVNISGWTMDSTHYVEIYPETGYEYQAHVNTSTYVMLYNNNPSVNPAMFLVDNYHYVYFRSFRIQGGAFLGSQYAYVYVICCDLYIYNTSTYCANIYNGGFALCLIGGYTISTGALVLNSSNVFVYNCFLYILTSGVAISTSYAAVIKNCYSYNATASSCYPSSCSLTSCASADTTGSSAYRNIPWDVTVFSFVSWNGTNNLSTGSHYKPAHGSILIGNGANLSSDSLFPITTDIFGIAWDGVFDIGLSKYKITDNISIVDPNNGNGTNYTSLSSWESAKQGDLIHNATREVAKCRCTGGTAFSSVNVNGWTCDTINCPVICTDINESYRHVGSLYTTGNVVRIEGAAYGVLNNSPGLLLDGLLIKSTNSSSSAPVYQDDTASIVCVTECVLYYNSSTGTGSSFRLGRLYGRNVFFFSLSTGSVACVYPSRSTYLYNCTIIGFSNEGFYDQAGCVCKLTNCYSKCGTSAYYTGTYTELVNCASSDTTGTAGLQNIAFDNNNFISSSSPYNIHLTRTSTLRNAAINLFNTIHFDVDIDSISRGGSTTVWDIGCDEVMPFVTITGTLKDDPTAANIVAGGKTIILTLTDDTWISA